MSDRPDRLKRFRIPDGSIVPADGFLVLYEDQFRDNSDPTNFTFNSAHGGTVYITQPDASGNLAAQLAQPFGAAQNAVSFGRYTKSDGKDDFTAMACRTFGHDDPATVQQFRQGHGLENSCGPKIGPVVINEVMYQPPDIMTDLGPVDNVEDEFVELRNITAAAVPLYDPSALTNHWKVRGGITFEFTTSDTLPPGGYLLLVNFDPMTNAIQLAAFKSKYSVPDGVPIRGPYGGKLSNGGDVIELYQPDPPQLPPHPDAGFVPYVLVDHIQYRALGPWPTNAARTGNSIQRALFPVYGNDPVNWRDASPTAGRANDTNQHPVTLTVEPQQAFVFVGSNVTFTATLSVFTPVTYQWYFKTKPLKGQTDASLTILKAKLGNSGSYHVVASSLGTSLTSSNVSLSVFVPITIRLQPRDRIVTEGKRVVFKTRATGTRPLHYQWLLNGTPIPNGTNSVLIIPAVQQSDTGIYSAQVSNAIESKTSSPAILTVNPP
jgi:hypothetical protein